MADGGGGGRRWGGAMFPPFLVAINNGGKNCLSALLRLCRRSRLPPSLSIVDCSASKRRNKYVSIDGR